MPRVHVNGVNLHYKRGGEEGNETVVFVNGLTMDTTAWRDAAHHLENTYRTVRYDCRGQGESDKPEGPYTPQQHKEDLLGLLDALDLEEVHLVGLSNGGIVASLVAAELGATKVKTLSVVDSFSQTDAVMRSILRGWRAALEAGGSGLRFDVATPWVWGHSFMNQHTDEIASYRDKAAQADADVIGYLIDGLASFESSLDEVRRYDGPLLAVVGEEDILTPQRYSEETVAAAGRGRLVVLDQAGHAAPIERPEEIADLLRDFLAQPDGVLERS